MVQTGSATCDGDGESFRNISGKFSGIAHTDRPGPMVGRVDVMQTNAAVSANKSIAYI